MFANAIGDALIDFLTTLVEMGTCGLNSSSFKSSSVQII